MSDLLPHTALDDIIGTLVGTFLASIGVFFLTSVEAVTSGTAGLALLLSHATGVSFGPLLLAVSLPFVVLGIWKRGFRFGMRTLVAMLLVAALTLIHPQLLDIDHLDVAYGTVTGNLLIGLAMLILFRHDTSLGGMNTLALLAQDHLGWRAGYVQLAFDAVVLVAALSIIPASTAAISAVGAIVLNLVLIANHRPGRYIGS